MERDGIGTEEIKLRDDNIDPLAVEDHLFAHPKGDPDVAVAWAKDLVSEDQEEEEEEEEEEEHGLGAAAVEMGDDDGWGEDH